MIQPLIIGGYMEPARAGQPTTGEIIFEILTQADKGGNIASAFQDVEVLVSKDKNTPCLLYRYFTS